jgi:tRNA-splicing ligase RtcB
MKVASGEPAEENVMDRNQEMTMEKVGEITLERVDEWTWRIPKESRPGMRVDGIIFAGDKLMQHIRGEQALEQVANVATLPGIVRASFAMPDIHWGYGFCIGGVAATDVAEGGVISPGGVGYDINCGVRLLRTDVRADDVRGRLRELVDQLYRDVPCGVGVGGSFTFKPADLRKICVEGAGYLKRIGLAWPEDIAATEAGGCIEGADPDAVSATAFGRGFDQCGTLGSGNHFVELQVVEQVFDFAAAEAFGLVEGNLAIMIHSGSRGFGYQVCEDAIHAMRRVPEQLGIALPDRQLVCAPVDSPEGRQYLGAMRSAANYAWANRQLLANLARGALAHHMKAKPEALGIHQVYDVAHNIAKIETHEVAGRARQLCVHRKGATRAFGPGHPELPERYRAIGQPVLIPGDMGRASYVLAGTASAMTTTFGSTCHGAGRVMSRSAAIKSAHGRNIEKELAAQGIIARARGRTGLAEEQPSAYKDVNDVVDVVVSAGLSRRVARLRPMGVIKG